LCPPFAASHDSVWSCTLKWMRCPSRETADAVTGSIRPPPGRLIRVRPVSGKMLPSGPSSIIGCSARHTLSDWSSEHAVIWIWTESGHGFPTGWPSASQPSNRTGPSGCASTHTTPADSGALPHFWGLVTWLPRG
jgi:hypothetical protein